MNRARYLNRMDQSMQDKMKVLSLLPDQTELVLDVGCATGNITRQMGRQLPDVQFHGIDISIPYVGKAVSARDTPENVSFSRNWLADLHDDGTRYDAITMMSVMHEVFSYGKGVTSVMKMLCDAVELLRPGGRIIIRDMLRPDNKSMMADRIAMYDHLEALPNVYQYIEQFDTKYGIHARQMLSLNDFLLHMLYLDNWVNELQETYMPFTVKEYFEMGKLIGLTPIGYDCYLLDYVRDRWRKELFLNNNHTDNLYSTGLLAMEV